MSKHLSIYSILVLVHLLNVGLSFSIFGQEDDSKTKLEADRFVINLHDTCQTIDNFGASDAWSVQYIGLWPEEKQQQMATWLFSTENDEMGNPMGIGLPLWRFYIGAGSKEQGEGSEIDNPWRRAECFLLPDGTYDWEKQKGQRNFMRMAKQQGVEQFLGFVYSPPVYWTKNGLATNLGRDGTFNLQEDKYDNYTDFIADVVQGIKIHDGIALAYISPFNEPDGYWNWDGRGQEGTAATKFEIAKTGKYLSSQFEERGMDTKIILPESSDFNCMLKKHPNSDSQHGYQLQSYFLSDSVGTYLGNIPNVPRLIAGHGYWTNTPLKNLKDSRQELGKATSKYNVRFWQTELCIMSNDEEIGGGLGRDLTMKTALYVARVIHHDLVYANASAWHWWLAVSNGDYKDGLIYTNANKSFTDGTYTDSKLMWTLGNYSRFIRPGALRIDVSAINNKGEKIQEGETDPLGIMISAYKNADGTLAVIVINYSQENRPLNIDLKGMSIKNWQPYVTSDSIGFNLKRQPLIDYGDQVQVPSKSVITLIGNKQ